MVYTLAEAAVACGLDKSTIRRAVRSGRISGTRNDLGVWHVEPCELHRVFPPAVHSDGDATTAPRDEVASAAADALVAELRRALDDLRNDRDHWRGMAERLALPGPLRWWPWRRAG